MFAAKDTLLTRPSVGGYQISRSLRFNSADTAYLARTPSTTTNRTTFTFSAWVKTSTNYSGQSQRDMITAWNGGGSQWDFLDLKFSSGILTIGGYNTNVQTTAVFRDPSAWYHFVWATDTTQATDTNRFKLYVNGVQQTISGTYPPQNQLLPFNTASVNNSIGWSFFGTQYFDGYMTEIYFVDGQALTPSSFGETNAQTGVWQPKAYSGSYGTNGFYLNFSDNSNTTAATLGKDYSGNGNNWTPNNFSVTAGAGNDSLVDSPTSYGTDTGVGGTVRGNYATLNPIALIGNCSSTDGNLIGSVTNATGGVAAISTIGMSSGKWYWEVTPTVSSAYMIGIGKAGYGAGLNPFDWQTTSGFGYFSNNGNKYTNSVSTAYGASYTTNDVIGVALDMDAGTLAFYKNGTSQGTAFTGLSDTYHAMLQNPGATGTMAFNFGQRPFAYTAPSGFKALCTQNLPTPTIGATTATQAGKYFNTVLYTGTGSSQSITGVGFQPDWVWIKSRSAATSNSLYDAVRGVQKELVSNNAGDQVTETTSLTAFGSDGFTVGALARLNTSAATYVAWNWKANGAGSSNTAGSITATVSASSASGFSVVTYTGTGIGATVGHGLGVAPQLIFVKGRDTSTADWFVYTSSLAATQYLSLNLTSAFGTDTTAWNSTAPTSTVFSVGGAYSTSFATKTYVAYCFAPIAGYSAFGSYTGNGSADGPFVFTGFRPAYVLYKGSSASGGAWDIHDDARSPNNVAVQTLFANTAGAEGGIEIDILSNGFKIRDTSANANSSGVTYIYAAFADSPFKYSIAR